MGPEHRHERVWSDSSDVMAESEAVLMALTGRRCCIGRVGLLRVSERGWRACAIWMGPWPQPRQRSFDYPERLISGNSLGRVYRGS